MKKIYLLIFLLAISNLVFSQWESFEIGFDSPLNIWDMDAVDENVVWAITTDGTYSGDGWSVATSATFATTADGGATWTVGDLPFPSNDWSGWMVSATDANTAWVAASNPFSLGAAIYKTADGGITWTQQNIFSANSFCSSIHFWDANNGVALGDINNSTGAYEIYTTLDGGDTWIPIDGESIPNPTSNEFMSTSVITVVGDHIWFGTRYSRVFHSPDRGLTWTASTTPISTITSNTWVEGIAFKNESVGIAHSANYSSQPYQYLIAYTEDGGATWIEQPATDNDFSIFHAQYVGDALIKTSRATNGAGPYATSYSFDHGINWTDFEIGAPINDFDFLDNETAWGGKFKNNNDPTLMYKYTGDMITNLFTPKALEIEWDLSPNPTADQVTLTLDAPNPMEISLELYGMNGQLLSNRSLGNGSAFKETVNLSDLPNGMYYIVIRDATGAVATKEVVKN